MDSKTKLKQAKIRHSEYYDLIKTFDTLYENSKQDKIFNKLMDIITTDENIILAYRNIKRNTGSMTAGTDNRTIKDLERLTATQLVNMVKRNLSNYKPKNVRRKEIRKPNGKMRPLGIPCIFDRITQQCILQVMEPIAEAKFFDRSNGFRPNRSTEHAIAQTYKMIQRSNLYYTVNIDIKGFFDNVNHNKLKKQIWNMGIRDKKLISIISAMLNAKIEMPDGSVETPTKGTPQGGILSPLLSNIVLNDLDWWIYSQWEGMKTKIDYKGKISTNGTIDKGHKYTALRRTKLKEMYQIRYADDFIIFCRNYGDAIKTFNAVKQWLKERLDLDISENKSKVIDIREKSFEYLGFKIKAVKDKDSYKVSSNMCDKAIKSSEEQLISIIKDMKHCKDNKSIYNKVCLYNSTVWGIHNYYQIATNISVDCKEIGYRINKVLKNRLKNNVSKEGVIESEYIKDKYGKSEQIRFAYGHAISPISYISKRNPMYKKKSINKYTEEGREEIHKNLNVNKRILRLLMKTDISQYTIEYIDNRISLYVAQNGKCSVTGKTLEIDEIHCHHKLPKSLGGGDEYSNLVIIDEVVHKLIHAVDNERIKEYLDEIKPNKVAINKINILRDMAKRKVLEF